MGSYAWAACLFAVLAVPAAAPRPARADGVDTVMRRVMAQAHVPGAAVAIVRSGQIVSMRTFGSATLDYPVAVTADTPFQIASSGKLYSSVLLMRLVEQGRLRLDDPVTRFIAGAPPAWRAMTIRHLATHTSGLPGGPPEPDLATAGEVVRTLFAAPLARPPGVRADYDSADYIVLQSIIEQVTGKPFARALQDEVLGPAGMRCTVFDNADEHGPQRSADVIAGRAVYYHWTGTENRARWFLYPRNAYAAGGAYSCLRDMAGLVAALDAGRLVSPASFAALQTPAGLRDGTRGHFAVGWATGRYRGHRWMGHSGGPAFSDVMYFPEDHLGIVVLANQQLLYPEIASLVADQLFGAAPSEAGPADAAPALSAAARRVLAEAARGAMDASLLAPAARADLLGDMQELGPAWLGILGPVTRMDVLRDDTADCTRTRRYKVLFGSHPQDIIFTFDRAGLISGIDPENE